MADTVGSSGVVTKIRQFVDKYREPLGRAGGVTVVLASIVTFVAVLLGLHIVIVEFIPFYAFVAALVFTSIVASLMAMPAVQLDADQKSSMQQLIIVVVLVAAVILVLSIAFCLSCVIPRPREMFVDSDVSGAQLKRLEEGVTEAEEAVCKYITRADQFIKGDVGPAGKTDPSLVTAAEEKARAGVNLVLCSDGAPASVAGTPDLADLENRIARLESTLSGFTGVVFKHAYDTTVPCQEEFQDAAGPTASDLEKRLAAVRQTIADQQEKYLGPMDQKTKDLQAGKASDCDKKRGAKLAVAGGPKAPTK
jgi:hypothetical protein